MSCEEALAKKAREIEDTLAAFLPADEGYAATVIEAMRYAAEGGGKRIRPVLMTEAFAMSGGCEEALIRPFAAAIEMIHTYSLVHDDLPAMDDDDLRRGRATTHVVYGEGMGVLTGDALLNYAYETALKAFDAVTLIEERDVETVTDLYERIARALQILAKKAGIYGMVGGQCADLIADGRDRQGRIAPDNARLSGKGSEEELRYIHEHKTSALLEAALMCGATLGGASDEVVALMEETGRLTGYAFQIRDDILDATGDEATLGKTTGQDEKNEKTTYVSLHGLTEAEQAVAHLSDDALNALTRAEALLGTGERQEASEAAAFLKELIRWMSGRDH